MGVTCDSIRAGALALVALAWLGGPAAAEATAAAANAEMASAPPAATAPAETSPAAAPAPTPDAAATPAGAAAPAVDPQMAAAVSAALDALVAADVKASPVGAGDWRAARLAIRIFYAARGFAPVWLDGHGLNPQGQGVLRRLERADEDGLDLAAFPLPKDLPADATPERLAEAETTLSAAVVAYAMQASGSRIVPTRISSLITARPTLADPGAALAAVAAAADPDGALAGYNPQQKGYRDLRDQLSRTRAAAPPPPPTPSAAPTTIRIPDGPSLGLGMQDTRVPLVRARLGVSADGSAADVYDLPVAAAVQAFQRANGLPPNGALTPATAAALSGGVATPASAPTATVSPARRLSMLVANMEMWRWEPRDMGAERIEINIPDYTLRMMEGDDLVHQARVIVGKPDTPTPVFSNAMKYILVNPIWRVPDSIVRKELAPHLAEDPDYLTRRGYQVAEIGGHMFVSQPPGEGNALGHILFMFPNEHAVYLHDTPLRGLFGTARRAYSHGCVRLDQPMRLAELVMGAGWSARLQAMIGSTERTVMLPHAIPIHLEYFTEFVDATGALQEREDVYGIAARVAGTIAKTSQD
ncbi:MAG: L,D-transpeptidase family protein [Roseiarcus sp.]|jgi:murein L,D-transpeptidase YcbB/YkuD|uniref:L,D-transpeptidase family protein n=1 Tax=Roseiarcus sp. TaxID=1969460 RepID=UPI003C166DFC